MKIAEPALHVAHIISPVELAVGGPRVRGCDLALLKTYPSARFYIPLPF